MVLFAVNTGVRDSNVRGLEWTQRDRRPGRGVQVQPRPRRILNDAAWSIVRTQRGLHPIWVFPFRGRPIGTMNNTGWQDARRAVGLNPVRVHDLRWHFAGALVLWIGAGEMPTGINTTHLSC